MKKKYFTPEMEEMDVEHPVLLLAEGGDCPGDSETEPIVGCPDKECDDF